VINLASAARVCLLAAVVALAPAAGLAQPEPTWRVFDEKEDKTPPSVADAMLKLANVTADDVVYDLGCGDGVIVIAAAKDFGARALGVDTNPKVLARARVNAERHNVAAQTTFIEGDLYKTAGPVSPDTSQSLVCSEPGDGSGLGFGHALHGVGSLLLFPLNGEMGSAAGPSH
jgi:SAM-dependent methyltransferase